MNPLVESIFYASAGGILIGVASLIMLAFNGRIAGISGILGSSLGPRAVQEPWRLGFLSGMIGMGAAMYLVYPQFFPTDLPRSTPMIVMAGLFVGFGTRLGSGCTSGHGVCGIGRLSTRSMAATATFMATAIATVAFVRFALGGA